jgi:hypothetical protein
MADELTAPERQLLDLASGGISLPAGSPAEAIAERLAERGYMKTVIETGRGYAWKLTGAGCAIVYADVKRQAPY